MIGTSTSIVVPAPNHFQPREEYMKITSTTTKQIITLRSGGWTLQQTAELFKTDRITIRKIESKYFRDLKEVENVK